MLWLLSISTFGAKVLSMASFRIATHRCLTSLAALAAIATAVALANDSPPVAASDTTGRTPDMNTVQHLSGFQLIELRRYTIKPGGREHFARYFESYFPEAFEQLGAIAFGHFFERTKTDHFMWLRGFKDMDARVVANSAFYFGPLWKEHRQTMNDLLIDSDDVLLLRPLHPDRGVLVLPAVDVVKEAHGATGIAVAQIFAVKTEAVEVFSAAAERAFETYRGAGMKDAGVLVTLDAKNSFPQLPVRSDGPYLVWLGVFEDEHALDRFRPLAERATQTLAATGSLRGETELAVLDPAPRSRLRWLPQKDLP